MKSDLNRLILLGFICQGLSWDDYLMPLLSVAVWFGALALRRRTHGFGQAGDVLGMMLGSTAGYVLAHPLGASSHFFIGHGLTLLQASRLTRELNRREKVFSLVVALGQVGVACTVILDYRFIVILIATLLLLPRALAELEAERFTRLPAASPARVRFSWATFATLLIVLTAVFFGSPRGLLGGALPAPSIGGPPGTIFDDMIDPSYGGQANSTKTILQIDGKQLGYLRMFCLTVFEDGVWRAEPAPRRYYVPAPEANMPTNLPVRSVRVKNANYLNKHLPHDGQLVALQGNFFRSQRIDDNNVLHCLSMWNTANNAYRYWVNDRHHPVPLDRRRQRLLTRAPELTPALRDWLATHTAGATNDLDAARRLETWLTDNFTYGLGAPNINRLNALEDFLLREQRGHCERFASAMALLLRARGIPARVVVGFVPGPQNLFSGWRNVRFNDAHAWTEAWFPEAGWLAFDATPRANLTPASGRLSELLDALDAVWYANFVNYNNAAQQGLIRSLSASFTSALNLARTHAPRIVPLLVALGLWWLWRLRPRRRDSTTDARRRIEFAEDCYGRLLQSLARRGITKLPEQTPREFIRSVPPTLTQVRDPLRRFTEEFQRVRYGNSQAAEELRTLLAEVQKQLGRQTRGGEGGGASVPASPDAAANTNGSRGRSPHPPIRH